MTNKYKFDKSFFVNRELSWLDFNERVLQEAENTDIPILERINFLGIFSNNQDEFYRVRVATLKRITKYKKNDEYEFGKYYKAKDILKEIESRIISQQKKLQTIYESIKISLHEDGIFIINEEELKNEIQKDFVVNYFRSKLRPYIFPIMMKNYNTNCVLRDSSIYLAIEMRKKMDKNADYALIEVPSEPISRFVLLPETDGKKYIMFIDDIIRYNLNEIFAALKYTSFSAYTIKFTRDAELDIDNDISKSFLEQIADSLKQRNSGNPVRYVLDANIPEPMFRYISKKIGISENDTIVMSGRYHNFKDFMHFPILGKEHLKYNKLESIPHKRLDNNSCIFSELKKKDVILNYPYHSLQYIIDMLREASIDPLVKSIKMTIYRIGNNSNVINALIAAARNGKKVTVFMELQARFDEQNNIAWSTKLHNEGVKVIQSIQGLKVHAKLIIVERKENRKNVFYTNIGTGNFNESTAKTYCDIGLLTSDQRIGKEVNKVFEMFEASYRNFVFSHLVVSPMSIRFFIYRMLNNLIDAAKKGQSAHAIIKLNNFVDVNVAEKFYQAAKEGVKFDLIVRGICVIQPINENINITSIVGRFLEHSRVLYFNINGEETTYITSADFMKRNLDNRIEVICPIYDKDAAKLLKTQLDMQLNDNVKARYVNGSKNNTFCKNNKKQLSSQIEFHKYLTKHKLTV